MSLKLKKVTEAHIINYLLQFEARISNYYLLQYEDYFRHYDASLKLQKVLNYYLLQFEAHVSNYCLLQYEDYFRHYVLQFEARIINYYLLQFEAHIINYYLLQHEVQITSYYLLHLSVLGLLPDATLLGSISVAELPLRLFLFLFLCQLQDNGKDGAVTCCCISRLCVCVCVCVRACVRACVCE